MRSRNGSVRSLLFALATLASLIIPQASSAHPMGNFSISHYSAIHIERGYVEVRYFIDMAEIPTYQEMQRTGIIALEGDASLSPYLAQEASVLGAGLLFEIDGRYLDLRPIDRSVLFTPGAGGLPTMKVGIVYRAPVEDLPPGIDHRVHYQDRNFAGHTGWKEIVITNGVDVSLAGSSVPAGDRSAQLSNYPTDLLNSPPQDLEAIAGFTLPGLDSARQAGSNPFAKPMRPPASALITRSGSHATASTTLSPMAELSAAHRKTAATATAPDAVASPAIRLEANRQKTPRSRFTELVSVRNMSFWFLFTAGLIAAGLGAMHALEPGHGKTIVAAYLVGSRGTPRHAVLLGIIVTAAHTTGVYVLGVITLYASRWIVPEQLYPWLGIVSGLMIAGLASYLLLRAWTGETADHSHDPGQLHSHWFASLLKPRGGAEVYSAADTNDEPAGCCLVASSCGSRLQPRHPETLSTGALAPDELSILGETDIHEFASSRTRGSNMPLRQLLTLGITGGMVPCPAALVVLLSALSLHRVGLGLFLIVAFSLGLAAVLILIGLLMVSARQFIARWKGDGAAARRWLPLASSAFMLILGVGIAVRAAMSTGIGAGFSLHGHLVSFAGIILLGFFLGMRHSTDPDHVVAVSTIVSRERSVRHAALIGVLWGIGHTLTISVVGSLIILFGLVIPPRVGLSMEFCVAVMLILLGVLNLTGMLRWLTEKFTPAGKLDENFTDSGIGVAVSAKPVNRVINEMGYYQLLRPLVVGLVHGLAGSAAVALLVLSTIHRPLLAIAYLVIFGVGTIAGMMLMTSAIALPIAYTGNRFARAGNFLGVASGVVSTAFGMFLIYQIGLVDGLFTGQLHWIPR